MHTTPPSLLDRLRQPPNQEAWSRFAQLYTPLLLRWAYRLGLPAPDAADLVQEVFVILIRKLPEFEYDPQQSFRAWLRTVTLNKWRDRCSQRSESPLANEQPALAELAVSDPVELIDEAEYRRYLSQRALDLIQREFEPPIWQAFWECAVAGRPASEVGPELGMSPNAVYLAKGRVLRRLREELHGLLD